MNLRPPAEEELRLRTSRLSLVPLLPAHAEMMAAVLADPQIYTYLPQNPPAAETLRARYESWSPRVSPAGDELWLNWMILAGEAAVGHAQAGFRDARNASVAYVITPEFQRLGYAAEAVSEVMNFLRRRLGAELIRAWVDTRNEASIALMQKLGFGEESRIAKADHFKGADSHEIVFAWQALANGKP